MNINIKNLSKFCFLIEKKKQNLYNPTEKLIFTKYIHAIYIYRDLDQMPLIVYLQLAYNRLLPYTICADDYFLVMLLWKSQCIHLFK